MGEDGFRQKVSASAKTLCFMCFRKRKKASVAQDGGFVLLNGTEL